MSAFICLGALGRVGLVRNVWLAMMLLLPTLVLGPRLIPALASTSDPYPSLSSITPASGGSTAGGDTITISGSGFTSDARGQVTIDGVLILGDCNHWGTSQFFASFTVINDTTITAVTPPHAAGTVQVTIEYHDPIQTPADLSHTVPFTFGTVVSVPSVTSVSPNSGPTTGGTSVDIIGAGFTGATYVWFGLFNGAAFSVVSDGEIRAVSPPGSGGGVHINICLPGYGASSEVAADVFHYVVNNTPPTPSVGSASYSGIEGSPIAITGTAADADGDNVTPRWSIVANPSDDPGAACTVAAPNSLNTSLTCNDEGTYTLTLTATDSAGNTATANSTVTATNATPTVGAISGLPVVPIAVNTTMTASAAFADPGTLDSHSAVWTWGDGATSGGTVTETVGSGSGSVSGTHTYTAAGVYTVSLAVSDADGLSGSNTFEFVVVYDPSAGFLTGGGWIDSPPGAYVANPNASGRANFGFVSQYQHGATVPSGSTQFQFQTGNLDFHSNSYQWLVVTGHCRGQFKGTGTINGSGDYTFILTAMDGENCANPGPDTFRIQITDNNSGALVYDNAYDQAIGGGDIALHS